MKALKILTTATIAGALVAGGIAGAAPAFASNASTVQPVITVSAPAVAVPAYTESAPIALNTTALGETDVTAWVSHNGALFPGRAVIQDAAGNAQVDLISQIESAVFNYGDAEAGDYGVYFTSAQDLHYDYASDTDVTYLAAQSPTVAVNIAKLKTSIKGFKTKTKKVKHGHYVSKKGDKFTVINGGTDAKVVLQYKKKGGKWKNKDVSTILSFEKLSYSSSGYVYNQGLTYGHPYHRGTQYFRILVKPTVNTSGVASKPFKFIIK